MVKCKRCGMPDTRPGSVFKNGICQACLNYDRRKKTDWVEKEKEFAGLMEGANCMVGVSGGKDSHWILDTLSKYTTAIYTITVHHWFPYNDAAVYNLNSLNNVFGYEHIDWFPQKEEFIRNTKRDFETTGESFAWLETLLYQIPIMFGQMYGVDYIVFGENSSDLYGGQNTIPDADVIYMSDYFWWDDVKHFDKAYELGFKDLMFFDDWNRQYDAEPYSQIDGGPAYMMHLWLKYPKFGYQRVCDVLTRRVRYGYLKLEDAEKEIEAKDPYVDPQAVDDFCEGLGYTPDEFWKIVKEADWNKYLR